jgi:hypothetical protein
MMFMITMPPTTSEIPTTKSATWKIARLVSRQKSVHRLGV